MNKKGGDLMVKFYFNLYKIVHNKKIWLLETAEIITFVSLILMYILGSNQNQGFLQFIISDYLVFIYIYIFYLIYVLLYTFFYWNLRRISDLIEKKEFGITVTIIVLSYIVYINLKKYNSLSLERLKEINSMNWIIITLLMTIVLVVYFLMLGYFKNIKDNSHNSNLFNNKVNFEFMNSWLFIVNFIVLNSVTLGIHIAEDTSVLISSLTIISLILTLNLLLEAVCSFYGLIKKTREDLLFDEIISTMDKDKQFENYEKDKEEIKTIFELFEKTKLLNKLYSKIDKLTDEFQRNNETLQSLEEKYKDDSNKAPRKDIKKINKAYLRMIDIYKELTSILKYVNDNFKEFQDAKS